MLVGIFSCSQQSSSCLVLLGVVGDVDVGDGWWSWVLAVLVLLLVVISEIHSRCSFQGVC